MLITEKKKMGRPIVKFRDQHLNFKFSKSEVDMLKHLALLTGKNRTDVIIDAVKVEYDKQTANRKV